MHGGLLELPTMYVMVSGGGREVLVKAEKSWGHRRARGHRAFCLWVSESCFESSGMLLGLTVDKRPALLQDQKGMSDYWTPSVR